MSDTRIWFDGCSLSRGGKGGRAWSIVKGSHGALEALPARPQADTAAAVNAIVGLEDEWEEVTDRDDAALP